MRPGTVIANKYELVRCLGEGGMGAVWEAINLRTRRSFALKLLRADATGGPELAERMLREASTAGRLHHPNVIEVYDVGETEKGAPFLVMQLLSGQTIEELLEERGRIDSVRTAAVGSEVAAGLAVAHAAGIVHRDLKPPNVFLHDEARGRIVKVLDFGVSKLMMPDLGSATTTGGPIGTPAYMSPEQAEARTDVDHRTDLWSLGVVLFEMASGRLPFDGPSAFSLVAQVLNAPIPRLLDVAPDADPRLDAVIARCLVRDPADRIGSARELGAELEAMLPANSGQILADFDEDATRSRRVGPHSGPMVTPTSGLQRSRTVWPVIVAIVGIASAGLMVLAFRMARSTHSTDAGSSAERTQPYPETATIVALTADVPASAEVPTPPPSASARKRVTPSLPRCPSDKVLVDPITGKTTCAKR